MRAGAFNEVIRIMRHHVEQSDSGEQQEQWVVGPMTRANVKQTSGARTEPNKEVFYEYMKTFIIHYYVNVDDFDRILYKGKQYRILSIDEDRLANHKSIMTELVNE